MMFTEKMLEEDEKRWGNRNVLTELRYCGSHMQDRKNMTHLDIRFYAYIMRKAYYLLKEQEPVPPIKQYDGNPKNWASCWYVCGNCERPIDCYDKFCRSCGRMVKWE